MSHGDKKMFTHHNQTAVDRYDNIERTYTLDDVLRLSGTLPIEHTLARKGAEQLWTMLTNDPYVKALGAVTGNQAVQMVRAGLESIYLSGWQVAADNNTAGTTYPDQSLYPSNSGPELVKKINNALQRADEIEVIEEKVLQQTRYWYAPIVADCEAGFGGALNAFELTKAYITAGAAGVHFEDQLASEKKCGHMGGKVLIPVQQHIRNLNAARLAADVMQVPTVIVARTDAESATLLTSNIDERDHQFITDDRTEEGFYKLDPKQSFERCVVRGIAYAPYCDLLWMETSTPDLKQAKKFAEAIRKECPEQMLAYNCSPSFNWSKNISESDIKIFQNELGAMGYKYQFITLAGFHALNYSMFELALDYHQRGMPAFVELQNAEFAAEDDGYTATKHQTEVGASYFDAVATAVGSVSTSAVKGSTEEKQF
jgi:isocitrate lyase